MLACAGRQECPPHEENAIQPLLTRLSQSRASLKASLDGLREAQMTGAEVIPGFTVRDLMAVSAAWDQAILEKVEAYVNGDPGHPFTIPDVEAWNRQARDARRSLPLMQLRMVFLMTRGELGSLLQVAPPEIVDHTIEHPSGEYGTIRRLIERYCIARDLEYAELITAWRAREGI